MIKVLIFADTNYRATIAEIRSLQNCRDLKIYVAVKSLNLRNKLLFKNFEILIYKKNEIIKFLHQLKRMIGPFTVLQNGENIIRQILTHRNNLLQDGINIPFSGLNKYIQLSNKNSFIKLCNLNEIATPPEIQINLEKFEQPFVIKPKTYSSKNKIQAPLLIENQKSFQKLKALDLNQNDVIVQRYINGPSYYYSALFNNGNKVDYFIQKNLHQEPNGKSVLFAVPSTLPDELISKIDKLFKALKWKGVMMFELKKGVDGKFYAIECNPRFWGPLQLSLDNGVNFTKSLIYNKKFSEPEKAKQSYIWLAGYLHGLLIKIQTKTHFQKYHSAAAKNILRDVWLRKDTFLYFFIEPIYILKNYFFKS